MKGLIIKPKWADLILDGNKTIEVRSSNTSIRGKIGLIKSKTKKVFGTAILYDCIKIEKWEFENLWKSMHQIDISYEELLEIYPNPHAWFLKDVERFDRPISYEHKLGCVIWVNLDDNLLICS